MGWEDKAGHEKYLHKVTADDSANDTRKLITDNDGACKRIKSIVNADSRYCIEKMLMPFFNSGDQYVPINNSFKVKFTRQSQRKILTMWEQIFWCRIRFSSRCCKCIGI